MVISKHSIMLQGSSSSVCFQQPSTSCFVIILNNQLFSWGSFVICKPPLDVQRVLLLSSVQFIFMVFFYVILPKYNFVLLTLKFSIIFMFCFAGKRRLFCGSKFKQRGNVHSVCSVSVIDIFCWSKCCVVFSDNHDKI